MSEELSKVEKRLLRILERYEAAQTRGDLLETILAVHTALEDALDAWLQVGDSTLTFGGKFKEVLPRLSTRFDVDTLNRQRNLYAHPKQLFGDREISDTADKFVKMAVAAWEELFDSAPPVIQSPAPPGLGGKPAPAVAVGSARVSQLEKELSSTQKVAAGMVHTLEEKDRQIKELQARLRQGVQPRQESEQRSLPWRKLVVGLLLILPLPLLLGLGLHLLVEIPGAWAWPLLVGLVLLVMCFFALLNMTRFLRAVGLVRIITVGSVVLVIATLVSIPSVDEELGWSARAGASLTFVLDQVGESIIDYTSRSLELGESFAGFIGAASTVTSAPAIAPTRATAPTATRTPRGTGTATPRPAATAMATSAPY